jgi:magnesium chelatase subunit H
MPRPISGVEPVPVRVTIVTLDDHLAGAVDRAAVLLARELPGLALTLHAAADFEHEQALARCIDDIGRADIVVSSMLFMDDHIRAVLPALKARRERCDAMIGCLSAPEITATTRIGKFSMDGGPNPALAFLKKLRGKSDKPGGAGRKQLKMLRHIPRILRFIPGTAQDMRAWFLCLQYFLSGSDENVANMVRMLVDRYAAGPRAGLRGRLKVEEPAEYPEVGVYHPRLPGRIGEEAAALPGPRDAVATVGLLVMRSYLLAGNTAHYDGVIAAMEAKGLRVVPAFSAGLDARPAVEAHFMKDGRATIDALVSLTGFSLVGGPAYNDAEAAEAVLAALDVPYLAAHALEFQTLEEWNASARGLHPVESTIMVAIPELDGAAGPLVFGGRTSDPAAGGTRDMAVHAERAAMLAARTAKLTALRRRPAAERKVAVTIFNFPPNAGATGTAAYLSVFESLFNTLAALKRDGYAVDMPESVDALRDAVIQGNRETYGTTANVFASIGAEDHLRRETRLEEIEAHWGPAPGRVQTDGRSIFVLGARFGNVFVGVQPAFGWEGDPMRLLFESSFAPTHAFSAYYRWLREDFGADAVLHFGTHGALEFMPGKQVGLSGACWPDHLIGDLPNIYLYAANNPSEGALAKRRSAATLVSHLTPPIAHAGLYRGLVDLKSLLERLRGLGPEEAHEAPALLVSVQAQAAALDLAEAEPAWGDDGERRAAALAEKILELEYTLIPHGLHVVGTPPSAVERADMLGAMAEATHGVRPDRTALEAIAGGRAPAAAAPEHVPGLWDELRKADRLLAEDHETAGILRVLDGRWLRPAPGGDVIRTPAVLPTGRNIHGFDPFRIPSRFAVDDGARQAERLLAAHREAGNELPETVAIVLWGTDNLKSQGGPIAQALALMGALPRFDSYGRLCGAELKPLEALGRPRIDVLMTVSGIFRDLMPLQIRMLAEASLLAASVDEPEEMNFVRKHALAYAAEHGCAIEEAALRVFGNADGAYGANVNHLLDSGAWQDEDELAETYCRRKSFAYGVSGRPVQSGALMQSVLADVEIAYQNLESVELGVTTLDQYFDTLGGISRAVRRAGGAAIPVYIGDQTRGEGVVRTLGEQVALETRTRMLNPKWYDGLLKHGYEGVRAIEAHVTNTMAWSATTGEVAPWVYQRITETYVLDAELRERLASLNPTAAAKVANRLLEAHERNYWQPEPETLEALRRAGEELEDRLEGVHVGVAA